MMRRFAAALPLGLVLLLTLAPGCARKLALPVAPAPGPEPAVHFLSPSPGSPVGNIALFTFEIFNFTLEPPGGAAVKGHGHLDVRVDQGPASHVAADTFTIGFSSNGTHTVFAELRDNNGAALDPPVQDSLNVTVSIAPTLSADVEPIFVAKCVCHTPPDPPKGEDLSTAAQTLATAVNVNSQEVPSKQRIVPGHSDQSYTVDKIVGAAGIVGSRMPLASAPLTAQEIQTIKDWIDAGALNN